MLLLPAAPQEGKTSLELLLDYALQVAEPPNQALAWAFVRSLVLRGCPVPRAVMPTMVRTINRILLCRATRRVS